MTSRRAGILGLSSGIVVWLVILVFIYAARHPTTQTTSVPANTQTTLDKIVECVGAPLKCLGNIAEVLAPSMAYGAVLGLVGLLIQLLLRGEWPTGQLNAGRPKVLDITTLVTVTVAAMIAGISTTPFFTGRMGPFGVVAFSYFIADAATLGVDKISELAQKLKSLVQNRIGTK